jgi:hypothetical protein
MISSTHFTEAITARRSASRNTGGPLHRNTSASGTKPTTSVSPHAFACLNALAWPKCARSKHPSMYTRTGFRLERLDRSARAEASSRAATRPGAATTVPAAIAVTAASVAASRRSPPRDVDIARRPVARVRTSRGLRNAKKRGESDIRERPRDLLRIRGKRGVIDYRYGLLSFRTRRAWHYATLLFLTL